MKKRIYISFLSCFLFIAAFAQKEKKAVVEGNQLYKEKKFDLSAEAYSKALSIAPNSPLANYNMGNNLFRLNKQDEAVKLYDNAIANSTKKPDREKAFYNKGVSFSKQKKLEESIEAYKNALKLDPNDAAARENLQKALLEKKKQDQQNQQNNKDKKDKDKKDKQNKDKNKDQKDQDKKDQQNKDKQDQQQQQKKQQSKLDKQQVEQLLKALEQKEKDVQKKMQQGSASPDRPDKDW